MRNLLLVEDDPAIGKALQICLRPEGYEVALACTAHHARDELAKLPFFDIIVLDVTLPDGNGIELCREVRSKNADVPIVMVTGSIDDELMNRARSAGANDYVAKPFSTSDLAARLRRVFAECQPKIKDAKPKTNPA